jgi:hypothetical protein
VRDYRKAITTEITFCIRRANCERVHSHQHAKLRETLSRYDATVPQHDFGRCRDNSRGL